MIQYLYTLQYSLYKNKHIPSGSLQSMRSLCEVSFGDWANYFLIVQWIWLRRGKRFLVKNLIYYISFFLRMQLTIFLLLLYYDWFVAIVSSSTGSPSMSYLRRFRAFPIVVRVGLFRASDTDVVWSPVVWILWYWLSGRYQACIPHLVCLWQELLPLDGNHASSLYVLHRKTLLISSFSYRRTPSYYLPCCFLTDVANLLVIRIQSSSFFQTSFHMEIVQLLCEVLLYLPSFFSLLLICNLLWTYVQLLLISLFASCSFRFLHFLEDVWELISGV